MTYNLSLKRLDPSIEDPTKLNHVSLSKICFAGAVGGLASWIVSAPSELIKCHTQLQPTTKSSWRTLKHVWGSQGVRGLYLGGNATILRDSVGYSFYFSSYELCKRLFASKHANPASDATDLEVLVSGGTAGIITWASIYPLDVIKTRIQAEGLCVARSHQEELGRGKTVAMAKSIFIKEGSMAFYRGLIVCSVRAFFVNAVQVVPPLPNSLRLLTSLW